MTKLLDQAFEAAQALPDDAQDELAHAISRQVIALKLARSDASYDAEGGETANALFDRLARKYGG